MADPYDILIIGGGPGGYVAAIRAAQLGFRTAVVEREHLGGICLNWGCIPTKALLRTADIFSYLKHAKEYGLTIEGAIAYDPALVIKRSRVISAQLNSGVGFLLKKNKVDVIWGAAKLTKAGAPASSANAKGRSRRGHVYSQTRHHRNGGEAARAAGHRARWKAHLDLFRGNGSGEISKLAPRRWLGRDWCRICLLLSQHGRKGNADRNPAAIPARRGSRDCRRRAQAVREAENRDIDVSQDHDGREKRKWRKSNGRGCRWSRASARSRAHDLGGWRDRQCREPWARGAGCEDGARRHRNRWHRPH